jgi:hypothetical protein
MKTLSKKSLILITAALLGGAIWVWSEEQSERSTKLEKLEGFKPYTPSRLEWLAVELNAYARTHLSSETGFSITFLPLLDADTIMIYVLHLPNAGRAALNVAIDNARNEISRTAERHGWESWVKIKERIVSSADLQKEKKSK